jgi:hypothetical protein
VALEYIKSLIEAARGKLPVIYTTGERPPANWDAGSWRWKSTRSDEAGATSDDDIDGNENNAAPVQFRIADPQLEFNTPLLLSAARVFD